MLDFSDAGVSTRKLYHMDDEWKYSVEVTQVLVPSGEMGTEKEKAIGAWW